MIPTGALIARRGSIVRALRGLVAAGNVIDDDVRLAAYETDAMTAYRRRPLAVVLPETTAEVAAILEFADREGVKIVPRGAGTSLSGGAIPAEDAIVVGLGKFNRILDIDYANRCVVAQSGVTNLAISHAVAGEGFYYAPDPSSQIACTIGGNVAENSGGVHCLKYGLTTNNVLGVELVTPQGEVVRLGGKHLDSGHYDLLGLTVGSEGLIGIVTEVTVRILKRPQTARALLDRLRRRRVGGRLRRGDHRRRHHPGRHGDDGQAGDSRGRSVRQRRLSARRRGAADRRARRSRRRGRLPDRARARDRGGATAARGIRVSTSERERLAFWAGRKSAFPAVGRLSPDYYCMDGTIPRRELPRVLRAMAEMQQRYGLRVANVFHAGDGNLHPLILYDANVPGEIERAEAFGFEILKLCVDVGGVLTGEHGVGLEKRDLMTYQFDADGPRGPASRQACVRSRQCASIPGKVFPTLRRCAEQGREHVHAGEERFAHLPRF